MDVRHIESVVPVKQLEPREECDLVIHGICRGKQDSQKKHWGKKRIKRQAQGRKTIHERWGRPKPEQSSQQTFPKAKGSKWQMALGGQGR